MRPSFHPVLVNDRFGDPCVFVDFLFERRALLFDLGDLRALAPRKLLRVSDVFVSHAHMDHFFGFDWLLRICLGREHRMRLYGPPGFLDQVAHKLAGYTWNLVANYETDFTLEVSELHPEGHARRAVFRCRSGFAREQEALLNLAGDVVAEESGFRVRCAFLDHLTPCLAYVLEEKQHVNVWKNRLAELRLPVGPWLRELKRAVLEGLPPDTPIFVPREGEQKAVPLALLADCVQVVPGSRIAYVTDCADTPGNAARIAELARDVELLFIETPFGDDLADRATAKAHLTARQAGRIAREAGAKSAVTFHYSPVYHDRETELEQQFAAAYGQPAARSVPLAGEGA